MKKLSKKITGLTTLTILALLLTVVPFPEKALAAGGVYPSSYYLSLTVGESSGFSVIADYAFVAVSVSADGPISASIGTDSIDEGLAWVSVYAQGEGSGNVYVSYNGATYDEEPIADTIVVSVSVSNPQPSGGDGSGGGSQTGGGSSSGGGSESGGGGTSYGGDWNVIATNDGSGNVQLSELKVEGFELTDGINGQYTLSVPYSTETVNIIASAEDSKAKVEGAGSQKLKVGENVFTILVTAENGIQQPYKITVTRRDEKIALQDLKDELKNSKSDKVVIDLKDGEILKTEQIELLKKYEKNVELNKYDEEGVLQYGWTLSGKNISGLKEFDPSVGFVSEQAEQLGELSNYASGLNLNFAYSGDLPAETVFRVKADTLGEEGTLLRLYYFDKENGKLTLEADAVTIQEGYAEFEIKHCSEYFLTRADILGAVKNTGGNKNAIFYIIMGAEAAGILVMLWLIFKKNRTIGELKVKIRKQNEEDGIIEFVLNENNTEEKKVDDGN